MKRSGELAMLLIANPMTVEEIVDEFKGLDGEPVTPGYVKVLIREMRQTVLPQLGATCPRPTYESGYKYVVIDEVTTEGTEEHDIRKKGAEVMVKDNKQRLLTMLRTSEPYAAMLDQRTREGKLANAYAKSASAALAVIEAIELGYDE